jgi:hypothetical protein
VPPKFSCVTPWLLRRCWFLSVAAGDGRRCRPAGPPTRPVRSTVRAGPPTAIQRRPINEHAGADQRACGHYEGPPRACPSPNPPYHRLRDAFRPSPRPRERRRPVPLPMDPKCCEVAPLPFEFFWARSGPLNAFPHQQRADRSLRPGARNAPPSIVTFACRGTGGGGNAWAVAGLPARQAGSGFRCS